MDKQSSSLTSVPLPSSLDKELSKYDCKNHETQVQANFLCYIN